MNEHSTLLQGRYDLQEIQSIGKSCHYQAFDLQTQTQVIVKKLDYFWSDGACIHFEHYFQKLKEFDHPSLENYLHYFKEESESSYPQYYIVTQVLSDSMRLSDYLDKHSMSVLQVIEMIYSIAQGLDHAHHKNVYHHELTTQSILINLDQSNPTHSMIIDFDDNYWFYNIKSKEDTCGRTVDRSEYEYRFFQEMLDVNHITDQNLMHSLGQIMLECLSGFSFSNFSIYEVILFKKKLQPIDIRFELKHLHECPTQIPDLVDRLNDLVAWLMIPPSEERTWTEVLTRFQEFQGYIDKFSDVEIDAQPRQETLTLLSPRDLLALQQASDSSSTSSTSSQIELDTHQNEYISRIISVLIVLLVLAWFVFFKSPY